MTKAICFDSLKEVCLKRVLIYRNTEGRTPFNEWALQLDDTTRLKLKAYIDRVVLGGSIKNIQSVGDGVFEIKINLGPGYRIYFSEIGKNHLLLLLGGKKGSQKRDIKKAKKYWRLFHVQGQIL